MKTIDSHFVLIPTLRRDNSGIEPCQVGIPTLPDKVRIPTLSRTILEFSRFLLCAVHINGHERILKNSFSLKLQIWFWNNFSEMFLAWPFSKIVKFWSVKKHGSGEWGLLALCRHKKIVRCSSLKPLVRFSNNFAEMFLGRPFSKTDHEILVCQETWLWWGEATCTIRKWKKILKILLLWNSCSDFEIILQKCSFGDPFQNFLAQFLSAEKQQLIVGTCMRGSCSTYIFSLYHSCALLQEIFLGWSQNLFIEFWFIKIIAVVMIVGVVTDFSPLPDDKILDWSKVRQISDNIFKYV